MNHSNRNPLELCIFKVFLENSGEREKPEKLGQGHDWNEKLESQWKHFKTPFGISPGAMINWKLLSSSNLSSRFWLRLLPMTVFLGNAIYAKFCKSTFVNLSLESVPDERQSLRIFYWHFSWLQSIKQTKFILLPKPVPPLVSRCETSFLQFH